MERGNGRGGKWVEFGGGKRKMGGIGWISGGKEDGDEEIEGIGGGNGSGN
jgi:hypothetical protein